MSRPMRVLAVSVTLAVVGQYPILAWGAVSFSGDTTFGPQTLIGNAGFGTFRIDGGSTYTTPSFTQIGVQQSGIGFATVTGAGSQWNFVNVGTVDVGLAGIGQLEILDGGVVNLSQSGQMRIASSPSSSGTLVVDGAGSLLHVNAQLSLGTSPTTSGSSVLRVSNGAIVNAPNSQTQISSQGRVELSDGLFRTGNLANNGVVSGSGELLIETTSPTLSAGRIEAGPGDLLRITGPLRSFQNQGTIAAEGGEIAFNRTVTNATGGPSAAEITLRDGLLRMGTLAISGAQLTNAAVLAAIGGVNDFYGRIENMPTGRIAVTNQSVLIFHDEVTAEAGIITVFPGSSAVFLEDLTMGEDAVLLADLAGTGADTGFGEIEVVGTASLGASLDVSLAEGFTPQVGDAFPLIAAGGISGSLALGDVPELPNGLMWSLSDDGHRVVLNVVPGLAGDYNRDGAVDTADYVVWRATLGQEADGLAADGNSNGKVDAGDYDF